MSTRAHHHTILSTSIARSLLLFSAVVAASGCGTEPDTSTFRSWNSGAVLVAPGGGSGWINNGLHDPTISGIDPSYPLASPQGMAEIDRLGDDEGFQDVIRYMVECALPEGNSVTKNVQGQTLTFQGMLGLAPEWEDGACDGDCQEWVSACMLARTNVSGETVGIWLQADHPALGMDSSPSFPVYEASFFGNLFSDEDHRYMCSGDASAQRAAFLEGRTCSHGFGESCDFEVFSDCEMEDRCAFLNPAAKTAADCVINEQDSTVPFHTITTYIADPAAQ